MTRLLVSVKDRREAIDALAGGADLIDVKDPRRGSLGRSEVDVWAQVFGETRGQVPLSAAFGELIADSPSPALPPDVPLDFVKFGLSGCGSVNNWQKLWQQAFDRLPPDIGRVAVAYADSQRSGAPSMHTVLRAGSEVGCSAFLLDTYIKRGTLFDIVTIDEVRELLCQAREQDMLTVLAGSLHLDNIDAALSLEPAYIAVRSAVCVDTRTGSIDRERVRRLADRISACSQA